MRIEPHHFNSDKKKYADLREKTVTHFAKNKIDKVLNGQKTSIIICKLSVYSKYTVTYVFELRGSFYYLWADSTITNSTANISPFLVLTGEEGDVGETLFKVIKAWHEFYADAVNKLMPKVLHCLKHPKDTQTICSLDELGRNIYYNLNQN
jgi:hypothetical protein